MALWLREPGSARPRRSGRCRAAADGKASPCVVSASGVSAECGAVGARAERRGRAAGTCPGRWPPRVRPEERQAFDPRAGAAFLRERPEGLTRRSWMKLSEEATGGGVHASDSSYVPVVVCSGVRGDGHSTQRIYLTRLPLGGSQARAPAPCPRWGPGPGGLRALAQCPYWGPGPHCKAGESLVSLSPQGWASTLRFQGPQPVFGGTWTCLQDAQAPGSRSVMPVPPPSTRELATGDKTGLSPAKHPLHVPPPPHGGLCCPVCVHLRVFVCALRVHVPVHACFPVHARTCVHVLAVPLGEGRCCGYRAPLFT